MCTHTYRDGCLVSRMCEVQIPRRRVSSRSTATVGRRRSTLAPSLPSPQTPRPPPWPQSRGSRPTPPEIASRTSRTPACTRWVGGSSGTSQQCCATTGQVSGIVVHTTLCCTPEQTCSRSPGVIWTLVASHFHADSGWLLESHGG